jgi:hypothetical protein
MKEFDIQKDNTHDNDIVSKSQDGLYAFNPESPLILWSTSKIVHYQSSHFPPLSPCISPSENQSNGCAISIDSLRCSSCQSSTPSFR